jgi:hypothetical protein
MDISIQIVAATRPAFLIPVPCLTPSPLYPVKL